MARIRTIKPQFWINEELGTIPRDARLLYIGLWNMKLQPFAKIAVSNLLPKFTASWAIHLLKSNVSLAATNILNKKRLKKRMTSWQRLRHSGAAGAKIAA